MTGFTFFQNYYDAISDKESGLSEEEQGKLYNAIFAYLFRGEKPRLKGACKIAFNLIVGSIQHEQEEVEKEEDISRLRSEWGKKGGRPKKVQKGNFSEEKGSFSSEKVGFSEKKVAFDTFSQKELPQTEKESEKERSKEKEKEKEYNPQEKYIPPYNPPTGETDGTVEGYLTFMREHPAIQEDLDNPSAIDGVDFALLAQKIAESSRCLQQKKSLKWLLSHYREIVGDSYKDFSRTSASDTTQWKGDLQLWQELLRAIRQAREPCGATDEVELPAFNMADDTAKKFMSELYKGLSSEIMAYFDPQSFLELCAMEEKDLKYERARFLKALPDIRKKRTEGNDGVG